MSNSTTRFSSRAEDYAKYRPGYPVEVIDILESECGLTKSSVIADVGSGTGIISELFLRNGNKVFAVEPNAPMRVFAEQTFNRFPQFVSIAATAEETTLENNCIDIAIAAQAFHWFDQKKARIEFARILKPSGWVVLIWNERLLDSTPFLKDYENALLRFGTDYKDVRHENAQEQIAEFFAPQTFQLKSVNNVQNFDFEGFTGRVRSASYTPEPGHPNYEPMMAELKRLYAEHNRDGIVSFEYQTRIYFGRLGN